MQNSKDTVCMHNMCNGCMACITACKKKAITIKDDLKAYNAYIDTDKCVNCGLCEKVCPRNTKVATTVPIKWGQGWANDEEERGKSSSGGYATAIMKAFSHNDGYVVSCSFENGIFGFSVANTPDECNKFRGSKYVKSNPIKAYNLVLNLLRDEKKVLFLGLPCQVAGIKNYIPHKFQKNLYTIDLICHGTPSPAMLERYFSESFNINLCDLKNVTFRSNTKFSLYEQGKKIVPERVQDRYTLAFLDSLDYTENCYNCEYATTYRVSDLSLGDSWNSDLPKDEESRGISLVLCQTEKGEYLLSIADIFITDVNEKLAIAGNRQLRSPSERPLQRNSFFDNLKKGKSFSDAVLLAFPKVCIKQDVKAILIKLKVLRGGVNNLYIIRYILKDENM